MRALPAALVVACLALPSLVHASALRCDNKLVSEGASKTDALAKCGEPVSKESKTEYVSRKVKAKTPTEEDSTEVTASTTVEEWTYNFGPHRLMQVAIFRDGRLVDVRSGSYGY
ncbi:DUF2845 domain-containing protein [Corallococcus carmarthensis]|uniref:DUF2845 domain-containing protein n=1 Tax=Corallococcus carmarthensis TaxID=2316728 RepID=A0A3A8JUD3_9BACT|nr:DUF2845 domain-containing protein [Corallococcus carmarthensis]NOK21443.1 DUF2845 domain-containing protein [Corallococcus carmarthensis]RKG98538.1 DUF2845 domain-containing protein [Corallococcus carmarthensis]